MENGYQVDYVFVIVSKSLFKEIKDTNWKRPKKNVSWHAIIDQTASLEACILLQLGRIAIFMDRIVEIGNPMNTVFITCTKRAWRLSGRHHCK